MAKDKSNVNEDRERRLAEALRANLKRRKEQARSGQQPDKPDEKPQDQ